MNLIIETIEKAIQHEQWCIEYHEKELGLHGSKKLELELELAALKVKLGEPTEGHEHNSFTKN